MHELINPNYLDQKAAFEDQFSGMTSESFNYEDYEATRKRLHRELLKSIDVQDKQFLISFIKLEPDWSTYNFERFPSIQWKIQNLNHLQENNLRKYNNLIQQLEEVLK